MLHKKYKSVFTTYIDKLSLNNSVKDLITDDQFINNNPEFYLYYPALFSKYFNVSQEKLDLLCIAGYLYYQATIFLDKVIDDKNLNLIFPSIICQEEAIKILSNLFPLNSPFWIIWNQRKIDYQNAIKLEKEIHKNPSFECYSELAILKSTFGNCAIDGMYYLSDKTNIEVYNTLIKTHDYFSIAYQLNDDILDFINDYKNKQFNWCIHDFNQEHFKKFSIKDCKKLFYIEGFAIKIFEKGIHELQQALDLLIENKLSQSSWFNHIAQMQNKFKNSIKEIIDYLQQLEADIEKSNIILENNTIEKAINTSVSYIKKCFNNNQWQDYYNQGGISNIWSSAFVLSKISSEKNLKKYFENEVKGATEFIISSKSFNNMWSYNSTWIDDADSTNFALISLFFTDNLVNYDYHNWVQFFNSEFFSTYNNSEFLLKSLADNHINNVQGWCSDHHCVSAVSLYFLTISNQRSDIKNKLLQNFKKLEFDNINAYWWTDNIYTLYYLFLGYKKLEFNDEMEHIQNYIITKIKDGLYHDYYGENLFFSALALEILVNNENFKSIAATITESLLKKQFKDGSWQESNSLCIPMPNKINPINKNYEIKKIGVNVRSFEFNRLFTTTSILRSLNKWKDQN